MEYRYTVRIAREGRIDNVLETNEEHVAIAVENKFAEKYGRDNVWIADAVQEILVG